MHILDGVDKLTSGKIHIDSQDLYLKFRVFLCCDQLKAEYKVQKGDVQSNFLSTCTHPLIFLSSINLFNYL